MTNGWSIEITTPDNEVINYIPRGDFNIEFSRDKNNPEFHASVPAFILYGDDFKTVYEFEKNHIFTRFDVKVFCDNALFYDGYFTIFECKFCEDTCSVEIEVQPKLKANCIMNADVEYNLLTSAPLDVPRFTGHYEFTFPSTTLTVDFYYPQSMKIVDVINWFLQKNCGAAYQLESEFLTSATNYVTGQPNELLDLYLEEMSDASNQGATQPATVLRTSLLRILNDLQTMYDIVWWLEGLTLHIEHVSYLYSKVDAIDLQQFEIIEMPRCFEYTVGKIPKSIKYAFEHNKEINVFSAVDFAPQSIEFKESSGAFFPFATAASESKTIDGVGTDLVSIAFDEDVLDDYVYLILEDVGGANLEVEESTGILSGSLQANNKLSWTYLLQNYHTHNKPYIAAQINGNDVIFKSVDPYKEQSEIRLKFDCNKFQEYDFAKNYVLTNLAYGLIDSYTINVKDCEVILKTKLF